MSRKIIVIGNSGTGKSALTIQHLKAKYGDDVVVLTPEEAMEQGLKSTDIANIPTYTYTAPKMFHKVDMPFIESAKVGKGGRARKRSKFFKL